MVFSQMGCAEPEGRKSGACTLCAVLHEIIVMKHLSGEPPTSFSRLSNIVKLES